MSNLDGKIILITGAAKGMGATEAKMAVERGATVILSDIIEDQLEACLLYTSPSPRDCQ